MSDFETEVRKSIAAELNSAAAEREALEKKYGKVWTTDELGRDFDVEGFMAPAS